MDMPVKKSANRGNSLLLSTTALAAIMQLSAAYAVPVELSNGASITQPGSASGYIESDALNTVSFSTSNTGNTFLGANGVTSLENTSGSLLTVDLYNTGSDSVIFQDAVTATTGNILMTAHSGTSIFRGDIGGSTSLSLDGGNVALDLFNDENMSISGIISSTTNGAGTVTLTNSNGTAEKGFTFTTTIGTDSDNRIGTLAIGDAGTSNTNNVIFYSDVFAGNLTIGSAGGADQTNNLSFINNGIQIYGNITGNASDTVNLYAAEGVSFRDTITGVDLLHVSSGANASLYANSTIDTIRLNGNNSRLDLIGAGSEDLITVNAHVIGMPSDSGSSIINLQDATLVGDVDLSTNNDTLLLQNYATVDGNITFGGGNDELDSYGTNNSISGSVDFGSGDDTFAIDDDSISVTGAMTNLENINIYSNGTLVVGHDITINSGVSVQGTLEIQAGKTLEAESIYADSGTLLFDIASPSSAGYLNINDSSLDLTGLTLKAHVTGADNLFSRGTTIKVAQGLGQLTGIDGNLGLASTLLVEDSALFEIYAMDGSQLDTPLSNSALYYVFTRDATIEEVASTTNNKNAGTILDGLSGSDNPEISSLLDSYVSFSEAAINNSIDKLIPTADTGGASGSQNFVNNTLDVTNQHIASLQYDQTGMSAGNSMTGLRPWMQVFGQSMNQGERGGIAGYDANTYGAAFGLDSQSIVNNAIVGAVFSYGNTAVNSRNANQAVTHVDSYQLTLYGNKTLADNNFVKGMAAYAFNQADSTRYNVGGMGADAHGKYDASIYTLRTEAGHDYTFGKTRVTPSLMAHYSHYAANGYSENGAGGLGLRVGDVNLNTLEIGASVETSWNFKTEDGGKLSPVLRAGYRYDVIGDNLSLSSSFVGGGSAFSTQGANPAQGTASIGGGLAYYAASNWELSANYEFEHKTDYNSNSGFLRAAYKF
jgi:outer membrane autotransporter protein